MKRHFISLCRKIKLDRLMPETLSVFFCWRLLFVILVVTSAKVAAAGAIDEEANSAYQRGDYAVAELLFRPLAEQGDLGAQLALSQMYFLGRGVPKDNAEGLKWVRKAAEHSGPRTQVGLGFLYEHGASAPQDYKEAMKWYRRAAEQGDAWGQQGQRSL